MWTGDPIKSFLWISLFLSTIFVWTANSYGDFEDDNLENNGNARVQMSYEDTMKTIDRHHRVRRAPSAPMGMTGLATVTLPSTTNNTNPIYIITSFSFPGSTTLQTTDTTSMGITSQMTTQSTSLPSTTTSLSTTVISMTNSTVVSSTTTTAPISCTNSTHFLLANGTCASRTQTQITTLSILRNGTSTDNDSVNALSLYLSSITNLMTPLNPSTTFTLGEIDNLAGNLRTPNLIVNSSTSIIFSLPPKENEQDNTIVLGGSFERDQGGRIVDTQNQGNIVNTNISVAGVFTVSSVLDVTSMRVIIISDSTAYANIDTITNRTLASSLVSAKLRRFDETISGPLTLNLYFQVLSNLKPTVDADYLCAFFDANSSRWNDSGCSKPTYNAPYARHECVCTHLSSFALVWLPKTPRDPTVNGTSPVELKAVDIASLVFQSLSIACFLGVVIHGTVMRVTQPDNFTAPRNLFPLLSCAVTMVLFVFYIALSMTVYTRHHNASSKATGRVLELRANPETTTRSSSNDDPCLPQENSLAFFTYFLIILMFCIKTGSGYLNYEHFVRLFPPPKSRQLITMFSISFLISTFLVSLAAGLHSNPSNKITNIVEGKICWFTPGVIHYFLTIPTAIFLAVNLVMFVLVARRMIRYARSAPNPSEHAQYVRRKRCVILTLSSCVTQGLGWLFGLLIVAGGPATADVVGWFFNIFNGLEGLWAIILYIFIRREGLDEDRIARPVERPSTTKFEREYDSPSMRRSDRRTETRDKREFDNIGQRDTDVMNGPYRDMAEMTIVNHNDTYHYDSDDDR